MAGSVLLLCALLFSVLLDAGLLDAGPDGAGSSLVLGAVGAPLWSYLSSRRTCSTPSAPTSTAGRSRPSRCR